jgi:glycosyltransferase involved in cell wall biosynthesis
MRVTHVITRLIVGGAQENTIASVLGLRQKPGTTVQLISGPSSGPEGSLEASVPRIENLLTIVPDLVRPLHPWKDARAWAALVRILRQQQPDIVHTHSGKAGFLGRLAARRVNAPVIVHTIHGPSFGPFQGVAANALFRTAERRAGRVTTHFVTVADAMTQQYLAAGIGSPQQYTRVLSGFALDPFLGAANDPGLRARYGFVPSDIVIGKIARLFPLKGHDELMESGREVINRCPRVRFLLVGDGILRQRLEARAWELGIGKQVVFTGLVPPTEVPRLVGIMDILVHLSRREGLPRALPQAMAAGKPVVAYDCDGAREVCHDGQTGFLLPPGDVKQLTERLIELAGDSALRRELGNRGQSLVRSSFSVEKMVDDLYSLYCRLLGATKASGGSTARDRSSVHDVSI